MYKVMNYSLSSLVIQIPMAKKTYRIPTGCQEQLWALRIQVSETKPLLSWEEAEKQICVSGNCKCQEGDIHKETESEGLLSGWGCGCFIQGLGKASWRSDSWQGEGIEVGGKWRVPDSRNHRCKGLLYLRCIACVQKNSTVASLAGMEGVRGRCQEMRMGN